MVLRQHFTIGQANDHEATTANVAGGGIRHGQSEAHGNGSVNGIAPLPEYLHTHFRGQRRAGADSPVAARDRIGKRAATEALQHNQQRHQHTRQGLSERQ